MSNIFKITDNHRKVPLKRKAFLITLPIAILSFLLTNTASGATIPAPDQELLKQAYSNEETLHYEISWMGVKAGTMTIKTTPDKNNPDQLTIKVKARSSGMLKVVYPVDDKFETIVTGADRLPITYKSALKEGFRRKKKLTTYDQEQGIITYKKNDAPPKTFKVNGPVYNEFTSFMIMRTLQLTVGHDLMVPTFADKKRHEVVVKVEKKELVESIFGKIETVIVSPHLPFKGLYSKTGAPLIWLTNDYDRVPVMIKAKVLIGSLTARLVDYQGQKKIIKAKSKPAKINTAEGPFL